VIASCNSGSLTWPSHGHLRGRPDDYNPDCNHHDGYAQMPAAWSTGSLRPLTSPRSGPPPWSRADRHPSRVHIVFPRLNKLGNDLGIMPLRLYSWTVVPYDKKLGDSPSMFLINQKTRSYGHISKASPGVSLQSKSQAWNLQILDPSNKSLRYPGDIMWLYSFQFITQISLF
jgi:hypothetical protein